MSLRIVGIFALIVSVACLGAGRARGDRLTFRNGGAVELPTSVEGDLVIVHAPEGEYRLDRKDLARLEPTEDPAQVWPSLADEARSDGADARLSAARWALDRGLMNEAVAMLREIDPGHPTASRMLGALDRLEAPLPDPDLSGIRKALGGSFLVRRGPHVVLLHQHDDAEASARLAMLEDVLTAFYLEFSSLGYELPTPRERLVFAWFAEAEDYRAFLRAEGASAFLNTKGYHHPTRRLVVAYDQRSDPEYRRARSSIERLPEGGERDRRRLLLEQSRRRIELGTAAHEMVHRLVAASRLAPRSDAFPQWLHEGLAMQFEAVRDDRWGGLGTPSPFRLADWEAMATKPGLATLLTDAGFDRGYRQAPYAHAWAFVFYLRTRRPEAFVRLIDGCRLPGSADEASCTELEPIENEFHRAMRELARSAPN